ncbi:hypothetical protein [Spirosoma koreense]
MTTEYNFSSELSILYNRRKTLDPIRQPEVAKYFDELSLTLTAFLTDCGVKAISPYVSRDFAKVDELRKHLKTCSGFQEDLYRLFPANVDNCEYIYKFQDFEKLIEDHRKYSRGEYLNDDIVESVEDLYAQLSGKSWIALSKYLNGYNPEREMIWWTADNIHTIDPYEARLKLGLISKSIPKYAVLMRVRLDEKSRKSLYIPNCVEAFTMPIFYAQHKDNNTGRTIDLGTATEGYSELVGRQFDVAQVEIHYCEIDRLKSAEKAPNAEAPRAFEITQAFLNNIDAPT